MDEMTNTTEAEVKQTLHSDYPENIIITAILTLFGIFGTTGNAFVLYVFYRKKDKNTSTVFILTLAMIDFLTCMLVIPFTIVVELMEKKIGDDLACKIYSFMATCSIPFSAFIMVAIAFDRYFCICRPWIRVLDIKSAKRIIIVLLVFVICLGITTSLAHGVYQLEVENVPLFNVSVTSTVGQNQSMDIATEVNKVTQNPVIDGYVLERSQIGENEYNRSHMYPYYLESSKVVYNGYCYPNEVILGLEFRRVYQKFYISLFIIAFVTVSILYGLIYRSILLRRSKRLKASLTNRHLVARRSTQISSITAMKSTDLPDESCSVKILATNDGEKPLLETTFSVMGTEDVAHTEANGRPVMRNEGKSSLTEAATVSLCENMSESGKCENASTYNSFRKISSRKWRPARNSVTRASDYNCGTKLPSIKEQSHTDVNSADLNKAVVIHRQDTRKSVREKTRIANIKTASILFTVTLVFIIAFLPAWLMATKLIPPNIIGFYMHFSYNVANPIIYAFFNHTFQNEVKYMLKCQHYLL